MAQENDDDMIEESSDQPVDQNKQTASKISPMKRLKKWSARHKMVVIPIGALLVLVILLLIPGTRYQLVGPFVQKTVTIRVMDSQKSRPVSQAKLELDGQTVLTDKDGVAHLTSHVGYKRLHVTKQYFKDDSETVEVPLFGEQSVGVSLEATGRLTPVYVGNRITGKPVVNALVDAGSGNTVQTNEKGEATIVMPAQAQKLPVRVITAGYLTFSGTITQDNQNKLEIVPAGVLYFLSNHSGKIDVIKANLDGSNRKTIYAGTGSEDLNNSSLLASRDWRYLVLLSKRSSDKPASLYLLDTSDDSVTEMDSVRGTISLIGWSNHRFFYTVDRDDKQYYEPKVQALKSMNAETGQLTTHAENSASGDESGNSYDRFGDPYIVEDGLVYTDVWYASDESVSLSGKQASIRLVPSDGGTNKVLKSFPAGTVSFMAANLYGPQEIYFAVTAPDGKTGYLEYEDGGIATINSNEADFSRRYPTYLVSPSGKKVFWREVRDGKNTLFIGDKNAENKQQLMTASAFTPYGWLTDAYILVQKSDSELYVTTPDQLNAGVQPLKVSDYYKTPNNYFGYGYGYGGQ